MAVLTKHEVWTKERPATSRTGDLTSEEQAYVKRALRFLRTRLGNSRKLGAALRLSANVLDRACMARGRPSASIVHRAARLAETTVDDLLTGRYPPEGACPHCGRD
jgi:hypothetical protein